MCDNHMPNADILFYKDVHNNTSFVLYNKKNINFHSSPYD